MPDIKAAPSETLGQAYVRQYDAMLAFLRRRTGNLQAAQELTQDIWLLIADRAEDRSIDNPDGWLRRIAVNISLNWLRQNAFRARIVETHDELPDAPDEEPSQDRTLHARQGIAFLEELLDELPPRRRAAFLLYRGQGLTVSETATELGVSTLTAKAQIRDALGYLRRRMMEAGLWP